eukprot:CAMPEP_0205825360 /NCGR_PEP_ID=MMETSP0206-20130828/24930_1 /ASSEMBLY_ACC=CAM_ASM_000279 /TAXON_ID=36767 /ORGANISM="Euplotes focardii, Strain TN1" /LENGTH=191 /DNA_ID=CAMNT_0053124343 /DNA_START=60 /DNA_END=635 /DNA_ORIENTATION=-
MLGSNVLGIKLGWHILLFVFIAANILLNVLANNQKKAVMGKPAAKLEGVQMVQGEPVDPTRRGFVTVVESWATWCPPCIRSIPHLNEIYLKYKARGVQFIGVTSEKDVAKITKFVQGNASMTYPVGMDMLGKVGANYPARGIPNAYVVGKDGNIAWTGHPATKEFEESIEAALAGSTQAPRSTEPEPTKEN